MKNRDSRFEVLRIISIFLIVLSHFSLYTNWLDQKSLSPLGTVWVMGFDAFGSVGAFVFFLISGFFGFRKSSKPSSINENFTKVFRKILSVWIQTEFYSVVLLLGAVLFGVQIGFGSVLSSIAPFTMGTFWFVTVYILVILVSPYLIRLLENISRGEFSALIFLMFILLFLGLVRDTFINRFYLGLFGYIFGYWLHKYEDDVLNIKLGKLIFSLIVLILSDYGLIFITRLLGVAVSSTAHFTQMNIAALIGICIFILVMKLSPFKIVWLNQAASGVFGVYLITENQFVREYLWNRLICAEYFQYQWFLPLYGIGTVIIISIVFIAIDILRGKFFVILHVNKVLDVFTTCIHKHLPRR